MRVLSALLGAVLSLFWANASHAQEDFGRDLTAEISSTYQIPAIDGHLVIPQGLYGTEAIVSAQRTVGQNGQTFIRQVAGPLVISPTGAATALDLPNIAKAWDLFWAQQAYRKNQPPSLEQSLILAQYVLTGESRIAIAQSMGKPVIGLAHSHTSFADIIQNGTDEFEKFDFNQLMANQYGSTPPASGFVRVMVFRALDFGPFDTRSNRLQIAGETPFFVNLSPNESTKSRRDREAKGGFATVSRPKFSLRGSLPLEPTSARPFVRAISSVTQDGERRRRVWIAETGRLRLSDMAGQDRVYEPEKLTMFTDRALSNPITSIRLEDLYRNTYLEVTLPQAKADEQARIERAGNRAERIKLRRLVRQAEIDAKTWREARDKRLLQARISEEIAKAQAQFKGIPLSVLGVELGMDQYQVRLAFEGRKAPFSFSFNDQPNGSENENCDAAIYDPIRDRIAREREQIAGADGVMNATENDLFLAFEETALEPLDEACRTDFRAFHLAFSAGADLGAGLSEEARVYFGTAGAARNRVSAVVRRFASRPDAPLTPFQTLRDLYGAPTYQTGKRDEEGTPSGEHTAYWSLSPDRAIPAILDESDPTDCLFDMRNNRSSRYILVERFQADCGVLLALHATDAKGPRQFSLALVDTDLFALARERERAYRIRELNRALALFEY